MSLKFHIFIKNVICFIQKPSSEHAAGSIVKVCCVLSLNSSQKAVRVTTLMKRLRASEQGDSAASGAPADPNTPSGAPAPPAGGSEGVAASIKAALSEKAPDTQTAAISALPLPAAARQEEQPQARCNGDVPQMLPQTKAD